MSDDIVKTVNLGKVYHDNEVPVVALKDINLTIGRGDFLVIAGPSGSGKTTLLNLIGALDKPTSGSVFLENEPLNEKSRSELASIRLRKIGFIFQAYNLIPVLTALENVEFTMLLLGVPEADRKKRALEIMEELGVADLAGKRPHEMSGGQQQRVAVARAIVTSPSIVLADEPTANLDSENGSALMDLMRRLNEEKNTTFVFASHDPLVIGSARRLITIRDGTITENKVSTGT